MQKGLRSVSADTLGITASGACMAHCAITPLLLAVAPGLAHYIPGDETAHRCLAALVLSAGALALIHGYRLHRKLVVLFGFLAGASLVATGALAGRLLGSHFAEVCVTVAGSLSMVAAHRKNRAFCNACGKCEH